MAVFLGISDRFQAHQKELKTLINGAEDLIAGEAIISSLANRNIVYTLEQAFEINVLHEERHFEQAKEVLEQMANNLGS